MLKKSKILSFLLCFCLLFEQSGFTQVAGTLDISGHIAAFQASFIQDKFHPLHLRSLGYDHIQNNFRLLLDKGDLKNPTKPDLEVTAKTLLNYFFVGVTLPNDAFWVNLRPDSENNIIDPDLAATDVGKILLEADLQLKKDTAKFTSPETPEGKEYWDKLYQKAGELLGYENVTIPTLTRPWIVPGEIIIRETKDNAYIYKATLKVMLEQDYLKDSATYNFDDPRLKTLNEYSSQLIRDLIIPKLTKEVNTSQRYASLRQVYYSLILAQWFKSRFYGKGGLYSWLIDRKGLQGLTSKTSWSKTTYFKAYQKSFKDGEYNIQQPVYTPYGQSVRSYFSGGFVCNVPMPVASTPGVASERTEGPTKVTAISGDTEHNPLPRTENIVGALAVVNTMDPSETRVTITEEASSPSGLPAGGLQSGASSPLGQEPQPSKADGLRKAMGYLGKLGDWFKSMRVERLLKKSGDFSDSDIQRILSIISDKNTKEDTRKRVIDALLVHPGRKISLISIVDDILLYYSDSPFAAQVLENIFNSSDITDQDKTDITEALLRTTSYSDDYNSIPVLKALENIFNSPNISDNGKTRIIMSLINSVGYDESQVAAQVLENIFNSSDITDKTAIIEALLYGKRHVRKFLERLIPQMQEDFDTAGPNYKSTIVRGMANTVSWNGSQPAREFLERLIPQMQEDFDTAGPDYKAAIINILTTIAFHAFQIDSQPAREFLERLIPQMQEDFDTAGPDYKAAIIRALLYVVRDNNQYAAQVLENIFNSSDITDKAAIIKALLNAARDRNQYATAFLERLIPQMQEDFDTAGPDYKAAIIRALLYVVRDNNLHREEFLGISDQELKTKITDFIGKNRDEIIEIIDYLAAVKIVPSMSFFKDFLRKRDTSLLDILEAAQGNRIFSDSQNLAIQINRLLNLEKRYEVVAEALDYLVEIGIMLKGAGLKHADINLEIDNILDGYSKDKIGDKKFLSELKAINGRIKSDAFKKIINRDLNEEEKAFLDSPSVISYLGNLVGLYFRLQNSYPQICRKAAFAIDKLLEFRDLKRFNQWLFKEAEWNKEAYAELIKSGYNPLLWDEGLRKTLPVEGLEEDIAGKMKQQTEQLIELADKYNIEIDARSREKGLTSYQEAEEFAAKYLIANEKLPQEAKDSVKLILEETKRFEERYKSKVISSKKVTVEIIQDFLRDTYSGVGIPGCFAPHASNNQMPLIHALETNALFLRIYNGNGRMIANLVLVLTPQGVVVQPLWNAYNFDLTRVVLEGLAELLLKDIAPAVLFDHSSGGAKEVLQYAEPKEITAVKKNTLNTELYFDVSSLNSLEKTEFNIHYVLTKEGLLSQGFKPLAEEVKEGKTPEKKKGLSKEEREEISKALFSVEALRVLELGPVLKNIEKIILDWEEDKIEKIVSSLTTRSPPIRGISEQEKEILKDKLLEIKRRIEKQEASSPVAEEISSASSTNLRGSQGQAVSSPLDTKIEPGESASSPSISQADKKGGINGSASSPSTSTDSSLRSESAAQTTKKPGGVDFRALPIVNQPINPYTAMLKLSAVDLSRLSKVNLDSEWAQIQNMVNAGIIPSNERIKEYVLACCLRQALAGQIDKVLSCIADIMRMEEDRVTDVDVELKDMLVLIEAGKPENELGLGLSQIKISSYEPQLAMP